MESAPLRAACAPYSLSFVVDVVALGPPQPNVRRARGRDGGCQHPPAHDRDVLSGRVHIAKPGDVEIQVLVVQVTQQTLGHDVLEPGDVERSEEHTSELQSLAYLVCRLLLEKKKKKKEK